MSLLASRKKRTRPELPLVPLIDVLVMLVLFAYVTMQARSTTALNITLPKVDTAGKNDTMNMATISIDKDGTVSFSINSSNSRIVTDAELITLLEKVKAGDRNTPVLIKADETTQLKKLAFVMDACRKTGLNKFSLQSR